MASNQKIFDSNTALMQRDVNKKKTPLRMREETFPAVFNKWLYLSMSRPRSRLSKNN